MRIAIITVSILMVLMLAVSVSAMDNKSALGFCLSVSTDNPNRITTPNGSDIQNVRMNLIPSKVDGFTSMRRIFVRAESLKDANDICAIVNDSGMDNLEAYPIEPSVDLKTVTLQTDDMLADVSSKNIVGRSGVSNTNASTQDTSYGQSTRRGYYQTSNGSSISSSSSMDAAEVYNPYGLTLGIKRSGVATPLPLRLTWGPVGGSKSGMINQESSDASSYSRGYSNHHGNSSYAGTSSSSTKMYRSANIVEEQLKDQTVNESVPNVSSIIIDSVTNAAVNGKINGAIFKTYKAPQSTSPASQGQSIDAHLHLR
jgi:hypothetical protein